MNNALVNPNGFFESAQIIHSPNFDRRPHGEISLIVIHNISLPPSQYEGNGIIELFTNQLNPREHPYYDTIHTLKVSSHFLIRRDGTLIQFVSCLDRAWHAGVSCWCDRTQCNDFSIGIELEGTDTWVYTYLQYAKLNQIMALLFQYYPHLSKQRVVGHSDIAPNRKTDPGPSLDWDKLQFKSQ